MKKTLMFLLSAFWFVSFNVICQETEEVPACLTCHKYKITNPVIHPPAAESCDLCHESTGNEHPKEGKKGFKLTDKMPDLCYMCHEESQGKNVHAPLESGDCSSCHSFHSSENQDLLLIAPPSKLCFECHDPAISEKPVKHYPVAEGDCQACHDPHKSDYTSLTILEVPALCFECHSDISEQLNAANHHPPAEDCSNCHSTHGSEMDYLMDQSTIDLCYMCHDNIREDIENKPYVHGIVNEKKTCSNCHSPHGSDYEKYLISDGKELCLGCHNKAISTKTRTLSNISKKVNESKVVHGAIEFNGCKGCHSAHASSHTSLLNESFPSTEYAASVADTFALCFNCHDASMLDEDPSLSGTNFRDGDRNMHYLHINGDKGRNCRFCHDMHGSPNEHMIATKVKMNSWEMPLEYKVFENGGSCYTGCHAEKKYLRK